jgi:hypothetical protein
LAFFEPFFAAILILLVWGGTEMTYMVTYVMCQTKKLTSSSRAEAPSGTDGPVEDRAPPARATA